MSRKRPTEASWDSDEDDDNLLNEDTLSFITTQSKDKYEDDELDEEALLADEEVDKFNKTRSGNITVSTNAAGKITLSTNKSGKLNNTGKAIIKTEQSVDGRYSPIKWDVKKEIKTEEFEFGVEPEEIELLAPDEDTDFDSFSGLDSSQTDVDIADIHPQHEEEHAVGASVFEENDEAETTHEHSHLEVDTTRDESDESEDEEEKRGGRFKSERQDIITTTTKKTTVTEIPATLEISAEQQAELNEFMAHKGKKRKGPNQRGPFQPQQNRIQTITSTNMHVEEQYQPASLNQQVPVYHEPQPEYTVPVTPPKQKMYVNPKFFDVGKGSHVATQSQPPSLMYSRPPRPQQMVYHHQQPPPPRPFHDHPQSLMGSYRHHYNPPVSQMPPHVPPQHFQGPHRNSPPRFQHHMEPRPAYGRPPPHMMQETYRPPSGPHNHQPFHPPSHIPPLARPRFHYGGQNGQEPRQYNPQVGSEDPRPNPFRQHQQRMQQQPPRMQQQPPRMRHQSPRMQFQHRNNFPQAQHQNMGGQRPTQMQPSNRFQSPKPSLGQQHSKKILQKAREARTAKFNNIQNIPVIGGHATKRHSTDDEGASPPKALKVEDDYMRKMEEQKALRERIKKHKETKRLMDAAKRRGELKLKLAKEGKTLSEIDSELSTDSGSEKAAPVAGQGQIQGSIGRGQTFGTRGQTGRGQIQRGQPAHRGLHQTGRGQFHAGNPPTQGQYQPQWGHGAIRGQGQQGFPNNQGQRGHPANRGQFQQYHVISDQGHQGQQSFRGQNLQRGRGQNVQRGRGQNVQRGRGQRGKQGAGLHTSQIREVHGSAFVDHQNRAIGVPIIKQEVGTKPVQQNVNLQQPKICKQEPGLEAQPGRQVNVPRVRRMKKIIRIRKNAQGVELSREEEMVPLDEEPSQQQRTIVSSQREVLMNSPQKPSRTVVASAGGNGRNVVQEGPKEKTVLVDNLSLSTSDDSLKLLCTCVGPIQSFRRMGKSAIISFANPDNAFTFTQKYHRHMIDLSHITAKLIKD